VKKSSKNRFENTAILKKNIISRRFIPSGRLFQRSTFFEISNRWSYEKIVVVWRDRGSFHQSHHKKLSILISQNLFHQEHSQRDISLNASSSFLKNARDRGEIHHLARQVYPDDPKFLEETYYDATSRPHGYLLLDLKQSTPDEYRFRMCIFPNNTIHSFMSTCSVNNFPANS